MKPIRNTRTGESWPSYKALAIHLGVCEEVISHALKHYGMAFRGNVYERYDPITLPLPHRTTDPHVNGVECGEAGVPRNKNPWPKVDRNHRLGDGRHEVWDNGWLEGAGLSEPDAWERHLRKVEA